MSLILSWLTKSPCKQCSRPNPNIYYSPNLNTTMKIGLRLWTPLSISESLKIWSKNSARKISIKRQCQVSQISHWSMMRTDICKVEGSNLTRSSFGKDWYLSNISPILATLTNRLYRWMWRRDWRFYMGSDLSYLKKKSTTSWRIVYWTLLL